MTPPRLLAGRSVRFRAVLVAVVVALVYGATSGRLLLQPSGHFHFVDMAESFLHGRMDTDTPRHRAGMPVNPKDPKGYQEAIDRALKDANGNPAGWNDWASYRVLQLKGGETVRGVFPWKDQAGPRAHEFYTLDGRLMLIDVDKDLRVGNCTGLQGISGFDVKSMRRCDDVVYMVSFPPGPALAMLPFAALFGYRTNDVLITLAFAIASAVLFFLWLERLRGEGLTTLGTRSRLWTTALFAFGTVAWYCSIRGEVWFTALVMGMTLHLAYLWTAQDARRPFLAGVWLGLGVATRTPLLFASIFLPLEALFPDGRWVGRQGGAALRKAVIQLVWFAIPMAVTGALLAWFNWARWGNPTEFGHFYLLEGTRPPTREHGLFNFFFLNHNLGTALLNMPLVLPDAPYVQVTRHGLGLLACTPALAVLLGCPKRPEGVPEPSLRQRILARHLLLTVAAVALPGFFYQNDGWQQFGYRFAMDFLPPLLGIFALRVPHLSRTTRVLIVLGIAVQLFGALTFGRLEQFYYD